jgi:hypothetical protein
MPIHTLDETLYSGEVAQTTNGSSLAIKNDYRRLDHFYVQNVVTDNTPASGDDFVDGIFEQSTFTFDTQANSTNADFFTVTDADGTTYATYLNVDGTSSEPTGEHYTGADVQIEADLSSLGTQEESTITFDTYANSTQGDYFAIYTTDGTVFAVALDKAQFGRGAAPTGTIYTNADISGQVNIHGLSTAIEIGAAVTEYLNSIPDFISRWSVIDNEDGSISITALVVGNTSNAITKDSTDSGAADGITAATAQAGSLGGTAAQVGGLVAAACDGAMTDVTVTDGEDGTVVFLNDLEHAATDAAVYDTDEQGVSTISVSQDADGVSGSRVSTNEIYIASHGYKTGLKLALTTSDTLPTGLSATDYYAIYVSDNVIQLATSVANANAGTAVAFTAVGSGTHTLTAASLASGNIKLQKSADDSTWIDVASMTEDITGDETVGWEVTTYSKYIRLVTTLSAGQLSVTSKIVG